MAAMPVSEFRTFLRAIKKIGDGYSYRDISGAI